jgi:hypothetical protein
MRDVRQHEPSINDRGRALLQNFSRLSPDERSDAVRGVQGGVEHRIDLGSGEVAGGTAVEHHVEGFERALGLPKLIRDDADGVVTRRIRQPRMLGTCVFVGDGESGQLHHRAHAGHFEDVGLVLDRGHLAAEGARGLDGGAEHAGDHHVDPEDRAAVALGRGVQTRQRFADELKSAALLERGAALSGSLAAAAASCPYDSFSPRALMTKPFSVRHCATSTFHACAAARVSTSRAAAPAVRRRS